MDDHDELAPHHVLEALTVPELPYDFTDRVMGSLLASPQASLLPRRSPWPWMLAACTSAVALAAMVMLWRTPVPLPAPVPVVADAAAPIAIAAPPPPVQVIRTHLVLSVEPHDATVRIDGEPVAGPSPFIATNLLPGTHTIVVERAGFTPWTRTIDVPQGELDLPIELEATEAIKPKQPKSSLRRTGADLQDPFATEERASTGKLLIRTKADAGPARVSIDGKDFGMTPVTANGITVGRHEVRWTWSDGRSQREHVTIRAGGDLRFMQAAPD